MKKMTVLGALALVALLSLAGCATTFTSGNGKLAYAEIKGSDKGTFKAEERAVYLIHPSVFSLNKPQENLDKVIDPKLAAMGAVAARPRVLRFLLHR